MQCDFPNIGHSQIKVGERARESEFPISQNLYSHPPPSITSLSNASSFSKFSVAKYRNAKFQFNQEIVDIESPFGYR